MRIEKAKPSQAKALTELTIRSKSHWPYSAIQIEKWREDLTITSEYIFQNEVYILISDNQLLGYYSYFKISKDIIKLDNLFVEPSQMGKGYGLSLMNHLIRTAKQSKIQKIILDSDPNAESFYSKIGFIVIGQLETSIPNRFLPMMELTINEKA